jgi:hypothetical protein
VGAPVHREAAQLAGDVEYFACETSDQGISPGYVDQYHQSIDGQQLDITGAPPGIYYLLSIANPLGLFVETDLGNNAAWVSFELTRASRGAPKIRVIAHSPCDTPGMCGQQWTNR